VDEHPDLGPGEVVEAAGVVEVEVRLDDAVDVREVVTGLVQRVGQRVVCGVLRNRRVLMGCGNREAMSERPGG
jgi:tetrahydromethanopterin S-methyltransferase subunit G